MVLSKKIGSREAQVDLLKTVSEDSELLNSRIISSIQPKIGRNFIHKDLEHKKTRILGKARLDIMTKCAAVEATREITGFKYSFEKLAKDRNVDKTALESIKKSQDISKNDLKSIHQRKIDFHRKSVHQRKGLQTDPSSQKRRRRWQKSKEDKRIHNKKYKSRLRERRRSWVSDHVVAIKTSSVRNLSSVDIPDIVYLYLAKGLGYVQSTATSKEDLVYDGKEFLRKLSWKAYFKQLEDPEESDGEEASESHPGLRIPSRKHPPQDTKTALFEDVESRLLNFIGTVDLQKPKSNLTAAEQRGKGWITREVASRRLFVTKADKGGATLILNFSDALEAVQKEMRNEDKFECIKDTAASKMESIRKQVNEKIRDMERDKQISSKDRLLITGLTDKGGMKHSPAFRATEPYPYPLFKIHKCTPEQLEAKNIPPLRLVHSTKQGPLYRSEKWCSPALTSISRRYCEEEFLLDTPDLIRQLEALNRSSSPKETFQLFTLDVVALYPSISVDMALKAMDHAFDQDSTEDVSTKAAVRELSEFILRESFVVFENRVYKGKKGIPTGNCISRQVADISMHWLLFIELGIKEWKWWARIPLWKRFIDDVLGKWVGTVRQFHMFVAALNEKAKPFGIQFADAQIGQKVHYLDVTIYIDEQREIQYCLYRKETDSRQFLNTNSFHPPDVFKSVPFSQMLRIIGRNSQEDTLLKDLQELKDDLVRCGHDEEKLEELEPKAVARAMENYSRDRVGQTPSDNSRESLVFTTRYFQEVGHLKTFVRTLGLDIKRLVGDVRIIFALKKNTDIQQKVVKNRKLSLGETDQVLTTRNTQGCGSKKCMTCPLLFELSQKICVNGMEVNLDSKLNCKSKGVVYLAQCTICQQKITELVQDLGITREEVFIEDSYFGQTISEVRTRMNGHRSAFKTDKDGNRPHHGKSALAQHCFDQHRSQMSMDIFRIGFVRICKLSDLDREECRYINKYRTEIIGLNRIKVIR